MRYYILGDSVQSNSCTTCTYTHNGMFVCYVESEWVKTRYEMGRIL